jgi:nitrilase
VTHWILNLGWEDVQLATFAAPLGRTTFTSPSIAEPLRWGGDHLKSMDEAATVPSAATQAISAACRQARCVVSVEINECEAGTLYSTQLLCNADGTSIQCHHKMTPTYHERMVWEQGDASGLLAVHSDAERMGS